jgi:hypothetical protein
MKCITTDGNIKELELFGQLSDTNKAFDRGYYISLMTGSHYFAEGEEEQRDAFLKSIDMFDEETPTWEDLYDYDDDSFYYSEWYVSDDMDGGYDSKGNYYLYDEVRELFVQEDHVDGEVNEEDHVVTYRVESSHEGIEDPQKEYEEKVVVVADFGKGGTQTVCFIDNISNLDAVGDLLKFIEDPYGKKM